MSLLLSVLGYMARHAIDGYRECVSMAWTALTNPWGEDPHEDRLDRALFIMFGAFTAVCLGIWALAVVITWEKTSNQEELLHGVAGYFALSLVACGVMRSWGRGQKWMAA